MIKLQSMHVVPEGQQQKPSLVKASEALDKINDLAAEHQMEFLEYMVILIVEVMRQTHGDEFLKLYLQNGIETLNTPQGDDLLVNMAEVRKNNRMN